MSLFSRIIDVLRYLSATMECVYLEPSTAHLHFGGGL